MQGVQAYWYVLESPHETCLLAYRGSVAYGMADPQTGDVDLMGIVLAPAECYLGLSGWGSRGTLEIREDRYDAVFYEIRKAFGLLLEGNPNIMSLLWLRPEHYLHLDEAGRRMLAARRLFTGRHVYDTFAGYAAAQLARMQSREPAELREYMAVDQELKARGAHPNHKGRSIGEPAGGQYAAWSTEKLLQRWRHYQKKGENLGRLGEKRKSLILEHGYDAKNAAHCIRLLRMCRELLQTGGMSVERPDAAELLAIRRGKWPLERIRQHARELFEEIRIARDRSPLPPGPDRAAAERLLVSILREHLCANGSQLTGRG